MTVYETTNHNAIYHWVTSNRLWPACVVGSPDRIRIGGDDSANPGEDIRNLRKVALRITGGVIAR